MKRILGFFGVTMLLMGFGACGGPLDQPLDEVQSALTDSSCGPLELRVPFKGDGVSIHSCPSASCPVVGAAYRSQKQAVVCDGHSVKNGFGHIKDLSTGVCGWVALRYVTIACD